MSEATNAKVAECLDMAIKARMNARSALSPADQGFWQIMEERWIHLAQTYRETERLTHSLAADADRALGERLEPQPTAL
jgi:hypothetical protein